MTELIDTQQSEFNIHDSGNNCLVKITVKTLKYEVESSPKDQLDTTYFDITYQYKYSGSDLMEARKLRPFSDDVESQGEIIKRNVMTEYMIQYLLNSDEQLMGLTGNTCLNDYRVSIMKALALFWD